MIGLLVSYGRPGFILKDVTYFELLCYLKNGAATDVVGKELVFLIFIVSFSRAFRIIWLLLYIYTVPQFFAFRKERKEIVYIFFLMV